MIPALTSTPLALIVTAALAYLVGSIPFGLLLARAMGLGNLREIGSGNIGATNVLRTGSKKAAALTLLLDAVKGAVPVLIARNLLGEDAAQVAGLAAFLGHLFPVWIGFRGGKGVATFLGVVLALAWPVGVAACMTWLVVAYATRYSSLSALGGGGAVARLGMDAGISADGGADPAARGTDLPAPSREHLPPDRGNRVPDRGEEMM